MTSRGCCEKTRLRAWKLRRRRRRLCSFEKFHLEPHTRCEFDAVSIYDGETMDASRLIGRYCGYALPAPVVSAASTVVVNFATVSSRTGEGFFASYVSVYGTQSIIEKL